MEDWELMEFEDVEFSMLDDSWVKRLQAQLRVEE